MSALERGQGFMLTFAASRFRIWNASSPERIKETTIPNSAASLQKSSAHKKSPKTKEAKRTWHFRMFECCAVTPSFRGPGAREEHGVGAPSDEQAPE